MNDDRHLDDLEHYLQTARVLEFGDPQLSGAHGQKIRLRLEGGVQALAKPESGIGEGHRVTRREVAAWIFAREIGVSDMVACTVLRDDLELLDGTRGAASVQVVWPQPLTADYQGQFPEGDQSAAAVLDAVIAHSDRVGHNWLGVPSEAGDFRLKLVDHGYAFGLQGGLNSTFYNTLNGQQIPEERLRGLRSCGSPRQERQLQALFESEEQELQNAIDRAQQLAETGVLTI